MQKLTLLKSFTKFPLNNRQQSKYEKKLTGVNRQYYSPPSIETLPIATMEVKSVGAFPVVLLKLAASSLPPQTKLNFEQNGWKWVLFWPQLCWGEWGVDGWTQSRTKNGC